jgi:hypothetical protein
MPTPEQLEAVGVILLAGVLLGLAIAWLFSGGLK